MAASTSLMSVPPLLIPPHPVHTSRSPAPEPPQAAEIAALTSSMVWRSLW